MKKHRIGVLIEKNAFVDEGDGVISFPNGLVITDESPQKNGTRYDIPTMDLSEYKGQVTADHVDMINYLIGKVTGVAKRGRQVVVDGIRFAVKENALGKLAYDLIKAGFLTDFSIETYGEPSDEEGVYYNAKLVGLSAVVVGNNNNATINELVLNSIEQSKKDGLDTSDLEKHFLTEIKVNQNHSDNAKPQEDKTPKASQDAKPEVTNNNGDNKVDEDNTPQVDPQPAPANPDGGGDNPAPAVDTVPAAPVATATAVADNNAAPQPDMLEAVKNLLGEALKPINDKFAALEQSGFDAGAAEPTFRKDTNGASTRGSTIKNEFSVMDWEERTVKQIESARLMLKSASSEAAKTLNAINEVNLEALKAEGLVKNAMTIADFGNFVISRELLTEIEGCRNDYTPLVNATEWRETLSTQMAWLNRSGDIDMQNVEFCDDDADGNLKPISEYTAEIRTANLEELAAVTPVCNAATRFLAADLLSDVAAGYRNDYDRKRAQLVVARLEQAVESNGNSNPYNFAGGDVDGLTAWLDVWTQIATCTPNGTFVFNTSTYAELIKRALNAGVQGPLATLFTTGNQPSIFGRPYIVVSDDLLPTLGQGDTKVFSVEGSNVTVNHAVFYANLDNFTGRISGGLQYDLSTDASYEVAGSVRSAYQRNELVLRGSFFRGGAVKDNSQVAALRSVGVS